MLAVVTALFVTSNAQAAILTFDDITTAPEATITNYGGLQWTNTGVLDVTSYTYVPSGYQNANTSGDYVAYNKYASVASVSTSVFDFVGANFTAAWNDDLNLLVEGLLNGVVTNTRTVTLQPVAPGAAARIDFNYNGIDQLRFTSFGGTLNPAFINVAPTAGAGPHFAMDDFEYNTPVPEPSTALLGLMGIGSLFRRIRRKK